MDLNNKNSVIALFLITMAFIIGVWVGEWNKHKAPCISLNRRELREELRLILEEALVVDVFE